MRNLVIGIFLTYNLCLSISYAKDGKAFSLFSVVTFKNSPCVSTSGTTGSGVNRNGTCYTSTECSDNGGMASGNCASGFGVCCLFIIGGSSSTSSTTVNNNNTYLQNPSYPSVYSDTSSISYTVNKCAENICAFRLDFETFVTAGPSSTLEADSSGHACTDKFRSETTTSGNSPYICGTNTGQHMYIYVGPDSGKTATLEHTFSGTSTTRKWEIKVSQIECGASYAPPDGCLQYHVGMSGTLKTFNFDADSGSRQHLMSQEYNICIRQEAGMCCVEYMTCRGETHAWSIDLTSSATAGMTGEDCGEDFVTILGASATCYGLELTSNLCGTYFTAAPQTAKADTTNDEKACDCTPPFFVGITTETTQDTAPTSTAPARGVCLEYTQVPCA